MCQRLDDRARAARLRMLAGRNQVLEYTLHAPQIGELGLDLHEPGIGNVSNRLAVRAIVQAQKPRDLIQREPQFLGALYKPDAIDEFGRILAKPAICGRYGQQQALLVLAYRFHTYASSPCQGSYSE
jgi:hypothetical protein